jgi:Fe-S cluster biogenesis protein NfuA/nitrite reductase/ring-hydroxylating ferredoxin subunit
MEADRAGELIALYGDGVDRIFAAIGDELREQLAQDEVVANLMLMHGVYPVSLAERVEEALESVRPYLASHEGDVELLGVTDDGIARLRLKGSCDGCAASAATLELAIEQALEAAAPDLLGLDVEGVVRRPERPAASDVAAWTPLDDAASIPRGGLMATGADLIVANVAGTLLAYRDGCAGCGEPLGSASLEGGTLTCAGCGRRYDLPRAGRCKDDEALQLEPVPLLRANGSVKVAYAPKGSDPLAQGSGASASAEGSDPSAHCELCPVGLSDAHRHLLHLEERRIICVCESCWSQRSGDPEFRPPGGRRVWLEDFKMPDELWANLGIPIGLAFIMRSALEDQVVALYPSAVGATEAAIDLLAWVELTSLNPALDDLHSDDEALLVNRLADPPQYVIAPLDECYRLVGHIKSSWRGISGGDEMERAVTDFFEGLRDQAVAA